MKGKRNRRTPLLVLPDTPAIEVHPDHITAVIGLDLTKFPVPPKTIGLRFDSVDDWLNFATAMNDAAAKVWPDHPLMQEYLKED